MSNKWVPKGTNLYDIVDRKSGAVKFTATRVDLVFGLTRSCAPMPKSMPMTTAARSSFRFRRRLDQVMNADRFESRLKQIARSERLRPPGSAWRRFSFPRVPPPRRVFPQATGLQAGPEWDHEPVTAALCLRHSRRPWAGAEKPRTTQDAREEPFREHLPEITAWRRDFHEHPELLFDVHRTAGKVAELLRSFGL